MKKVLVVDDLKPVRQSIEAVLTRKGFAVQTADGHRQAIDTLGKADFDLVLTDILMPENDGLDLIDWIKAHKPDTRIVAMSGGGSLASPQEALSLAGDMVQATIRKPFDGDELLDVLAPILRE